MTIREDGHAQMRIETLLGEAYADAAWVARAGARRTAAHTVSTGPGFVFDLASITKPFTASVALWCASRGMFALEDPVFPDRLASAPSLDDLLRHLGGAIAWWPLYLDAGANGGGTRSTVPTAPLAERYWPGVRGVYSDVGYLTTARWIEQRTQVPLVDLLAGFVEEELPALRFEATPFPLLYAAEESVALARSRPSPCTNGKEVELAAGLGIELEEFAAPNLGEPQDGNARWLAQRGVLAGHAGLFGTARAVEELLARWLRAVPDPTREAPGSKISDLDRLFRDALEPRHGRLLGWQQPPEGWFMPATVFGHFGFTGGMMWADAEVRSSMVLLAHRRSCDEDLSPSRRAVARAWQRWTRAE